MVRTAAKPKCSCSPLALRSPPTLTLCISLCGRPIRRLVWSVSPTAIQRKSGQSHQFLPREEDPGALLRLKQAGKSDIILYTVHCCVLAARLYFTQKQKFELRKAASIHDRTQ